MKNKTGAVFYIFALMNAVVLFWLIYFDVHVWVASIDFIYLTFIITIIYISSFVSLLWESRSNKPVEKRYDLQLFVANHLTALGLLGTVIGLAVGVNAISGLTINPDDEASIVLMMQQMFTALGTALITTIAGLICSLMLKVQIITLDMVQDHETE